MKPLLDSVGEGPIGLSPPPHPIRRAGRAATMKVRALISSVLEDLEERPIIASRREPG